MTTTQAQIPDTEILNTITNMVEYLNNTDEARKEEFKTNKDLYGLRGVRKGQYEWGRISETVALGLGTRFVHCEGHGGALTPRALNLTIDEEIRTQDGHYEEDDDIAILLAYYPQMGKKLNPNFIMFSTEESTRHYAVQKLVRSYPNALEKILERVNLF